MLAALSLGAAAITAAACVSSAAYEQRIESRHPPIGKLLEVNGAQMHVLEAGISGPPVLMIHGASANAREYTHTLAPLLEQDFRLFMTDRPGHGYSDRFEGAHALGAQAAQMAGVLDNLQVEQPAVIVGHSFGGAVALRLALDHPEKVKGLVLIAPVTHDWGNVSQTWYNRIAGIPVIGTAFSQLAPTVGPQQVGKGIEEVFAPAPAPENYLENSAIGLLFRPPNFRANAKDVRSLNEELAKQADRYGSLDMPVIVYSGEQDTVISPRIHVGQLQEQTDVTVVSLPHEGHMPHHAHAEDIADSIRTLASPAISR